MGGSASVTEVSIDFFCLLVCPGTSGDIVISPITTTGAFSGLGGTTGFIRDISGQPVNTPFSLSEWIAFAAAPGLFLDLQFIPLGQGTPSTDCVGVIFCTPIIASLVTPNNPAGLSAFNLSPGSASFEVRGIGYSGSSGTGSTPFIGRFSADFPGLTAADIAALLNGAGIANKAYSAAFVVSVIPPTPVVSFGGTPGQANCHGKSVSALTKQFGSLDAAASALGFSSVQAQQDAIREFCEE